MNSNCSVIVISDSNTSNTVEYVEKDGQTVILQDSNLIPSTPISYYNKTQINSYTGQTLTNINSRLLSTIFNSYTGTTIPNSYYNKSQINNYTGITVPNIYQTIANVNHYTGTTAPNSFLSINACANDSNKLGTHLSTYFLNTGSTITLTTCSTTAENALCLNGHTESNLSVNNSVCLNGHSQGYYLSSGGTAVCATSAINSKALCGCVPSCFLGATTCATDSAKLGTYLPNHYSVTGHTHSQYNLVTTFNTYTGTTAPNTFANKLLAITGGTSLGSGTGVYTSQLANKLQFKSFKVTGSKLSISSDATSITISGSSGGGTWGSITGALSAQTDLQNTLNFKLATNIFNTYTGTTAPNIFLGINACAADSNKLNNHISSYYLNTGSTAVCATCAGNASTFVGCTPSCFLGTTACACDSAKLGNHLPSYYLSTGSTAACANDSAKLNNKLPIYYLNTGSTAICTTCAIDSKALCGCVPTCFLGATACAADSAKLNNKLSTYYLNTGSTSINSNKLNNHLDTYFLNTGSTIIASNTTNFNGHPQAYFLLSGGTAINSLALCGCAPSAFLAVGGTAADSSKLNNKSASYYLNTGSTAICATTAINSKALCGCIPASFLLSGGTATCATSAIDSKGLCGCIPSCFLGATACATDSNKLNNHLSTYFLNTGSTIALSTCSTTAGNALCLNSHTEANLSVANSVCLNSHPQAYFLLSGGTAVCSTSSVDSKGLCGCVPSCFLGTTACAADSAKLGNHLPSYYLSTGGTVTCANDSAKLGGVLPAGYLLSGGTAICATSAINSLALCGCVPTCFLGVTACANDSAKLNNKLPTYYLNTGSTITLATCSTTATNALCVNGHTETNLSVNNSACINGHTEANLSVANSACLGAKLPAYYLNTGSTAICSTTAGNSLKLGNNLPAYYLNTGSTIMGGCTPSCFLGVTGCAVDSNKLNNKLQSYFLNTGSTIALATCATTATNSLCLNGHTEAALSVCNAVCVNGHAEANLSVANSACLGGHLPAYYLLSGGTAICTTSAINSKALCGCVPTCFLGATACAADSSKFNNVLPAGYLLSGDTAKNSTCLNGQLASYYLASTACAADSNKLNNHLVSYFLNTGSTITVTCAADSAKLNNVLPAGYLLSGGTAKNSLCLGGNLANTYASLANPSFTTCITTPIIKLTTVAAKTTETAVAFIKSDGSILSGTSKNVTATLTVSGWSTTTKQQVISVVGVTTGNTITIYPPSTRANFLAYGNSQINCVAQGSGTLTFECSNIPVINLIVNIMIT